MKFAVIEDGEHQVIVKEGEQIQLAFRKNLKENDEITINNVLLIKDDKSSVIGTPYVNNSKVKLTLVKHFKDVKVRVIKYKPKTTYRRNRGHRQPYSIFKVNSIS
ncbi:MAG: 50S ribosomal protein L21 [Planctomycetes bacterium]|nr:50S ribosomal protein L21 [Planctomycetota bacterium]